MVGHGKRTGGGSNKTTSTDGEGSYIVFSNASDAKSSKSKASKDANSQPSSGAPAKPDTRTLVAGASWTGKLPVNLLSEHYQKQQWIKPEYIMNKDKDGFHSMAILKAIHPKTKELVTLPPFKLPTSLPTDCTHASSAVEARHLAATYALFRVCSHKNIHMMLPPTHRDFWNDHLKKLKVEDSKAGKAWMYEADPFAAHQEREEAKALMSKKRDATSSQRAKDENQQSVQGLAGGSAGNRDVMRGWTHVTKVDLGKKVRTLVEELVRKHAVWNPSKLQLTEYQRQNIQSELVDLGFRRGHIQEAMDICKDREEVLEWLLIHVPEDDLPRWSLPENYTAGISMASANLKRDAIIKRLTQSGYSQDMCERYLDNYKGNEELAAEALQNTLSHHCEYLEQDIGSLSLTNEMDALAWDEEQETLIAIYDSRYSKTSSTTCEVRLEIPGLKSSQILRIQKSKTYPRSPPIISITSSGLPAYIRLRIYQKAVEHAHETLLGEPMIFNLIDWIEAEAPRIIEDPGKLSQVSAALLIEDDAISTATARQTKTSRRSNAIRWNQSDPANATVLQIWRSRHETPAQKEMLATRQSLPAWALRDAIVKAVNENQVTIISGETGSGKSTQSVQFILDDLIQRSLGTHANIICTQPRRISALGLADRVSEERCCAVGDEVGYSIRGESKGKPGRTKITFVTTGVLLRRLQTSGGTIDDVVASLSDVSHVVVDEVHERSLDTDFLLILLRNVLQHRQDLKVILMSATLDSDTFERYFSKKCTVGKVEIQGRTFPVNDHYVDDVVRMTGFTAGSKGQDEEGAGPLSTEPSLMSTLQNLGMGINYELIAFTVTAIDRDLVSKDGAILIFLPGVGEITRALDALKASHNVYALPLHASLTPQEQRMCFPPAPKGRRKVIAATNVAETSITIEDVVAVIDTGKVKETSFDAINNMVKLEEVWASRAACKQRRGRAGRVRAGDCYKLFTRNAESKMAERPEPEIRRVPLEQLCLAVRAMGIKDVGAFLASALTPPEGMAIDNALNVLERMQILDGGDLTHLGRHISLIPADLRLGKLMVLGALFGCLDACLTISAILTVRSPFLSPQAKREESKAVRTAFSQNHGDLIADLMAYNDWISVTKSSPLREVRAWCDQNFLSQQTLRDITTNRLQYVSSLIEAGLLPASSYSKSRYPEAHQITSSSTPTTLPLMRALITAAFNPQVTRIDFPSTKYASSVSGSVALDPEAKTIKYFTQDTPGRTFIHPSSTLFSAQSYTHNAAFVSYFSKIATSKVFVRDLTPCNVFSVLLFGGPINLDTLGRGLVVDGWIRVRGWARIGVLVGRLRGMLDEVLARRMRSVEDGGTRAVEKWEGDLISIVKRLVEFDGLDQ